jgi:hypothetical protein
LYLLTISWSSLFLGVESGVECKLNTICTVLVTSFSGVKVFAKTTYKAISCTCKVMRRDVKEHSSPVKAHKTTHQQASQYTDIKSRIWLAEREEPTREAWHASLLESFLSKIHLRLLSLDQRIRLMVMPVKTLSSFTHANSSSPQGPRRSCARDQARHQTG